MIYLFIYFIIRIKSFVLNNLNKLYEIKTRNDNNKNKSSY